MNRYIFIGILDFFIGVLVVVVPLGMLVFVLPKILTLYTEANADVTKNIILTYVSIATQIFLGIVNIFLGTRSFSKDPAMRTRYFKWAIIVPIVTILLFGLLSAISTISAIAAIYNLNSNL